MGILKGVRYYRTHMLQLKHFASANMCQPFSSGHATMFITHFRYTNSNDFELRMTPLYKHVQIHWSTIHRVETSLDCAVELLTWDFMGNPGAYPQKYHPRRPSL